MAKKRYFALGMALGIAVTAGAQVYAADTVNTVTAYLRNSFSITYDGEVQDKKDYDLLVYKDRSYMPVRYLSEMLGCDVKWDEAAKSITIAKPAETPKATVPDNEKPSQNGGKTPVLDNTGYGTLPQSKETLDYKLTATFLGVEQDSDNPEGRCLYIRLTNKSDNKNMRLDQGSTVFDINGVKSKYQTVDPELYDKKWYTQIAYGTDVEKDKNEIEGYIRLPKTITSKDMVTVTTNITIDGQSAPIPVTFKLDMSKIK